MTTALEGGEGSASRPGRSLLPGKTRYPLYGRLGGPQGRSGQVRKISPTPGFDPRTVQPVAIRNLCSTVWNAPCVSIRSEYSNQPLYTDSFLLIMPNPNFRPMLPIRRKITNKTTEKQSCHMRDLCHSCCEAVISSAQTPIQSRASYNTANYAPSFADCFN